MNPVFGCLVSLALLILPISPTLAAERVALVIGNFAYQNVPRLANPQNDAADIAAALERLGFDVTHADNLTYDAMRRALRAFSKVAAGKDIAIIYFAGHGIEVDHQNYLIPVDAHLSSDLDIAYEAIPIDMLLGAVERATGLRLILLDACRNNPFAASMKMTSTSRSIGRGLSRVEPGTGVLVSFAAKEGTIAADGAGRNSPYTKALLSEIARPGLEVNILFRKVRDDVLRETGGAQEPYTYGSLSSTLFYIRPPMETIEKKQDRSDPKAIELSYWNSVKESNDAAFIKSYIKRYPNGEFVTLAKLMINRIEKPPNAPPIADVPGNSDSEIVLQVQKELSRLGCDPGKLDGKWGPYSSNALAHFAQYSEVRLAVLEPTEQTLAILKSQSNRACPDRSHDAVVPKLRRPQTRGQSGNQFLHDPTRMGHGAGVAN